MTIRLRRDRNGFRIVFTGGMLAALACAAPALLIARARAQSNHLASARALNVPAPTTPATAAVQVAPRVDLHGDPLPTGVAMRLGTIRHRQESPIYDMAYTADGRFVVTDGDDGQLRIWDSGDGRLIRGIETQVGALSDFGLSSDSNTVMVAGVNWERGIGKVRHVSWLELATGRHLAQASWLEKGHVPAHALCADRRLFATGSDDGSLRILDARTGAEICTFGLGGRWIDRIIFTPDGTRIATASNTHFATDHQLNVFDLEQKKELRVFRKIDGAARCLEFSHDGRTLATSTFFDGLLFEVESGRGVPLNKVSMEEVVFTADSRRLAGIFAGSRIRICDVAARRMTDQFDSGIGMVGELAFSPDGRTLAGSGGPNVLHAWDLATHRDRLAVSNSHFGRVNALLFSEDGKTLYSASDDNTVRVWDLSSGRQLRVLKHGGPVRALELSRDGRLLVAPTAMLPAVYAWDLEKSEDPMILSSGLDFTSLPVAVRLAEDGRSVLLLLNDGRLGRWDLKVRFMTDPDHPQDPPADNSVDDFPAELDQGFLLAGGRKLAVVASRVLQVFDLGARKRLYRMPETDLVVPSKDERVLAIARHGGQMGQLRRTGRGLAPVRLSYDSVEHYTSGAIVLLDSDTGKEKLRIAVPGSNVWAMAFSPNGQTLAATTGWETGQIHIYDVATGHEVRTLSTPAIRTPALAFSLDGSRLASGMADTSVLIWDLRP